MEIEKKLIFTLLFWRNILWRVLMTNNKKYKYTQEEFLKIIYDLVGDEYTVLSDYNGNRNKIFL